MQLQIDEREEVAITNVSGIPNQTIQLLDQLLSELSPENTQDNVDRLCEKVDEADMIHVLKVGTSYDQNTAFRYFSLRISYTIFMRQPLTCLRLITELLSSFNGLDSGEVSFLAFAALSDVRAKCDLADWSDGWSILEEEVKVLATLFVTDEQHSKMWQQTLVR